METVRQRGGNGRRARLIGGVIAGAMAVVGAGTSQAASAHPNSSEGSQPNIVVFQTDDQALSQLSGDVMPNVMRLLAAHGTRFDRAYLTTPDCCPSRATLLTGQYGHNDGVLRNRYQLLEDKANVLPVWLRQAGYVTAHIGKFLNGYHSLAAAPGWMQWDTLVRPGRYYDYDLSVNGRTVHHAGRPRDYSTRVFKRAALGLIRRYVPRRRPLYLQIDEVAPHVERGTNLPPPQCNPIPDPRDEGLFSDAPLPQPPSFDEADLSDKPSFMRTLPPLSPEEVDRLRRNYRCGLAALRSVDRSVQRVYDEIRRFGELGRTVFIFYTDNGMFYGQHRIGLGKLNPYEEALSTPLVMRVPRRYLHRRRAVSHVAEPVANVDLAPTILGFAHAAPCRRPGDCRTMDGRVLTPLIAGRSPPWAQDRPIGLEIDLGRGKPGHLVCQYTGVRQGDEILIKYLSVEEQDSGGCVADDEWERYDLARDPFELSNVCFGGGHASCPADESQERLEQLMRRMRTCSGIPGRDPRPEPGDRYCG